MSELLSYPNISMKKHVSQGFLALIALYHNTRPLKQRGYRTRTQVRLPTNLSLISTGFLVGFKVTAFLFPLSRIDGRSLLRGRRFTSTSEGQELHLRQNQVIKDLIGLRPPSLTTKVISEERIALIPVEERPSDHPVRRGAQANSQPAPLRQS